MGTVVFLAVNPKIWLVLGLLFLLALGRRLWRSWRARRRAARAAELGLAPPRTPVSPAAMTAVRLFDAARTAAARRSR